ncbi:MAG: hypothetical protein HYR84_05055 [Planctomycetes bacterium]|nr:hypothetical protein [Planctomycetota bacterium]
MNALADKKVGEYVDKYFVAAFQRVGTFRIVGKQKQGGNVACYFCAPDGRVLHAIAGPVNSQQFLAEAKWIVETTQKAIADSKGDGGKFKVAMRTAHAEKLRREHGLAVEPITFDPPEPQGANDALQYRDPTGQPLAPILRPAPIDGPDVTFRPQLTASQEANKGAAGAKSVADKAGRRWVLGTQGQVHVLMAAHSMSQIDRVYASVFEGILGERISTRPVEVVDPFPWNNRPKGAPGPRLRGDNK